jgi:translocation and assembly module TamA
MGADPQPYTVKFDSTGDKSLDAAIKSSSQLESLRKTAPAGPLALIGRARADVTRMETACDSFGFYDRRVGVTLNNLALDDPTLAGTLESLPKSPAVIVHVHIETGPLFHLRKVTLEGNLSEHSRAAFGLKPGASAAATDLLAAGARLQAAMQEEGHAYANVGEPTAYEDAHQPLVDVLYKADAGPVYHLGAIQFKGLQRTHEAFVRRLLTIHAGGAVRGEPYRTRAYRSSVAGCVLWRYGDASETGGAYRGRTADHLSGVRTQTSCDQPPGSLFD